MSTSTPPTTPTSKTRNLGDVLQEFRKHRLLMQRELQKVIIGQDAVIEQIFAAIFTRGHCLLVGVPGWRRRSSSARWRRFSICNSNAFSSRPI